MKQTNGDLTDSVDRVKNFGYYSAREVTTTATTIERIDQLTQIVAKME